MNIAIFSPNQNPYSETFIQAQKNFLKGNVFYYYGYLGLIELEGFKSLVPKTSLWRYRIIRNLKNYPTHYINEKAVLNSLKKQAIDVILVEYGTHAFNLLNLLKSAGLPLVVHFHGSDASVRDVINRCRNYKEVFDLATYVIAVSRKMEQMLLDLGCQSEKLIYNACAAHPEFEALVPKFSKKQFIGMGRFIDKKAPYYTIMAFKEVIKKYPDAKLLLAGKGMLINTCYNLVRQFGLEAQVEFLGVIKPEDFRKLLSESLAFVQHSITAKNGDMEGTPVSVLEASVSGLPVISTEHAGIPDVIKHGETGLLCKEHDVEDMAQNMIRLLDDVTYAQQLGAAGKQFILKHFSMQLHIKKLQTVIEDASKIY
ncbi:glycosyltransferase family 4 protein [Winogradskyella sp. R77965]|uniref:glycosyltransferase family 4 protein n=1 Tax=Winogradskyella sp. R77965 TaxID=3093872 RepID=UPI0037DC18B1